MRTPTEELWPGVTELPDFKVTFPRWAEFNLEANVIRLKDDPAGMDLLTKMLIYSPAGRMSAKLAVDHPFFDSVDKKALPQYVDPFKSETTE